MCLAGLKERYAGQPESLGPDGQLAAEVLARLDRELEVIGKLGFPNYFLIVWDFVRFARQQGIAATARGSGVGSLVSYALHLSHVCPLEYDLLFERFLDESRREAPDIDIDFCQQRRGEVIQYVKEKYGVGERGADRHVRHAGGAGGHPRRGPGHGPADPARRRRRGDGARGAGHYAGQGPGKKRPICETAYESDPEVRNLLDLAMGVEGLARNVGTHAAAVVIADRPLTDYVPLQHVQDKKEVITQWAMGDVERAGLLKMDFLGLRNLTILSKVVELIEQTTGQKIDPYQLSPRRPRDVRLALPGRDEGRVPVGKRRHPRPLAADEARPLPRHHRHQRPLPARPPGGRHG